jgi:precorrin-6A/cobalt-precorrin-6A reductase
LKVLLLAGTSEARQLAERLTARPGLTVVAALAGRTSAPAPLPCPVRIGPFGGAAALADYLVEGSFSFLVDATHPFAAVMPRDAAEAATRCGVPRLRVVRPAWEPGPGDRWLAAADVAEAARVLQELGPRRALLTIGRRDLAAFAGGDPTRLTVRTVEEVDADVLPGATRIRGRGPFPLADEAALLHRHGIEVVVTKNSGGPDHKLVAARQAGIPVVMVRRPPGPPGPTVYTVSEACAAVLTAVDGAPR